MYGSPNIPHRGGRERGDKNVYAKTRHGLDEVYGMTQHHKAQMWVVCLGLLALCIVELVVITVLALSTKTVPYIVEVDAKGEVRLVGQVMSEEWSLTDSMIKGGLQDFLEDLRQIPSDREVFLSQMTRLESRVTGAGRVHLDKLMKRDAPHELFGVERRFTRIETMVRMQQKDTWRVTWREEILAPDGTPKGSESFLGEFVVRIQAPETIKDTQANPLGVFIDYLTVQENKK